MPVDHPVVAVPHRARLEQRRVGAGDLGLGHREERPRLAGDERAQEALLLVVRAEQVQDLGVPGVRCLAPEHELRVCGAPDLFVEAGVVEKAEPGPSRVGRHVRRPEASLARLLAELREERERVVVVPLDSRLVRVDVVVHERPIAGTGLEVLGGEQAHGH